MTDEIQQLEARRDELEYRLQAIRRDYGRGLDHDSEEQALQLENMEVLQEISRVAAEELGQVNERLAKLRSKS